MERKDKLILEMAEERFGKVRLAELKTAFNNRPLNIIWAEGSDGKIKVALLQPLTPSALTSYCRSMAENKMEIGSKTLINDLWIDGDEELRDETTEEYLSAVMQVMNIVELKKSGFGKI
jgi:hypothetical protein